MAATKSSFLDKVLGRIGRLDAEGLQTVVQRLARERSFLETLFNTIEDGVLVADETRPHDLFQPGRHAAHRPAAGRRGFARIADILPELDWKTISKADHAGGKRVVRHEFEVHYPRRAFSGSTPRRWTARPRAVPAWR
jgi:two-component system, sporulation sensor kinase E